MKIYLILLIISGICYFIINLETRIIIKKNGLRRIKKTCFEEKLLWRIKTLILWSLIIPNIFTVIVSIFGQDSFEKGILDAFANSEYWE